MSKPLALLLTCFLLIVGETVSGQYFSTPPTLDGTADNDYVTNGDWSVGWDDAYIYFNYVGGQPSEPAIIYLDVDPITPVSGGENSDGSLTGQINWGITPTLPFRADVMIYWVSNYAEYRTDNGSGGWSSITAIPEPSDRSNNGGTTRELRLAWTAMGVGGRPSSFNWFAYANSTANPGYIFNQTPSENPSGAMGSPRINFYYSITNTTSATPTDPFSQKSVEHRAGSDLYITGDNTFYDLTNNANNLNDRIILENNSSTFTLNLNGTAHLYGGLVVSSDETFNVNQNGTVRINTNGFIDITGTGTVSYNSTNSTLVYQNGGPYTVGDEWPSSGGATNITTSSSGTALTIPSDRQLNGNLTLETGSSMSLNESVELDVSGNLSNEGTITLNAENAPNGSFAQLKVDGSISGTGTVTLEQYLEDGWHDLAAIGSGNAGILGNIGTNATGATANTRNLYTWNATTQSWDPIDNNATALPSAVTGMIGYVGNYGIQDAAGVAAWTYTANDLYESTSATTLVHNTASGEANIDGWNFVANPYPCAFDPFTLNLSTGAAANITNSYSIRNGAAYTQVSPISEESAKIAPGQGFWVKTMAGSNIDFPATTMAAQCDVSATPTFYKTQTVVADRFHLEAYEAADYSKRDVFLLGMIGGTNDGIDNQYDAPKRLNTGDYPNLMSVAQGEPLAINAIDYSPNSIKTKKLQLRFVSGKQNEVYFIELHDSLLSNNYHIELEDLKLRRKHNLNNGAYKFVHDQAAEYRFVLHISPVTTINQGHTHTPVVSGGVNVGINGGMLVLKMDAPAQDVSGALLDLNGRRVMEVEYPAGAEQYELNVNGLAKGIYLLQLQSATGEEVLKVMIP